MGQMKKYKIGYTQGVYDMFHVGHLRMINRAKEFCDTLVVGVNADLLVETYKQKRPVISENDRAEIVRNLKAVDECIVVQTLDKEEILKIVHFDAIFIGDDWYGHPRWMETKTILSMYGVDVVFLPYTKGVSSTILRGEKDNVVQEDLLK